MDNSINSASIFLHFESESNRSLFSTRLNDEKYIIRAA